MLKKEILELQLDFLEFFHYINQERIERRNLNRQENQIHFLLGEIGQKLIFQISLF